jgi:hypothetical protein
MCPESMWGTFWSLSGLLYPGHIHPGLLYLHHIVESNDRQTAELTLVFWRDIGAMEDYNMSNQGTRMG